MVKKIFSIVIIVILVVDILLCININNYINVLNDSFKQNIVLTDQKYIIICAIINLIWLLIVIDLKLIVFSKEAEISGIKLKSEDRNISEQLIG